MKKIVDFYINTILKSPKYNSPDPVDDINLLFPDFKVAFFACVEKYKKKYPDQDVIFTETYRSNVLQEKYYNNGASKIKKDGMHHFGIAGDSIFIINGKRTYKGDVNLLRRIYKDSGLTILGMWDPLHVQYIPVAKQQELRNMVKEAGDNIVVNNNNVKLLVDAEMETEPRGSCSIEGEQKCYLGNLYICARNMAHNLEWAKSNKNC